MPENIPENKPIIVDEVEEIENGKDPYTWVDEFTNNAMKMIGFIWLLAGFSYCVLSLDIDKNLVYGFFASALPSVLSFYVLLKRKKEDKEQ